MELDLQSLFGLNVHICTSSLAETLQHPSPLPPPPFGLIYEDAIWSAKVDDISLWPPELIKFTIFLLCVSLPMNNGPEQRFYMIFIVN